MAQATKTTPYVNGTSATESDARKESSRELTPAQRRHIGQLVSQLQNKEVEFEAAQKVRDAAQSNANQFIVYCAEELDIPLGKEGWKFDQNAMAFVQSKAALASPAPMAGTADASGSRIGSM